MARTHRVPSWRAKVIVDPQQVEARLNRLGLKWAVLAQAEERGRTGALFAPRRGLPGHANYNGASYALEELRTGPDALREDTYLGIPVATNETGTLAITVTTGDTHCGVFDEVDPKGVTVKGPSTKRAAARQEQRLPWDRFASDDHDDVGVDLWVLLSRWCTEPHPLFELSRVSGVNDHGFIDGWTERIILSRPPSQQPGSRILPAPAPQPSPEPMVMRRMPRSA